MSFIISLSSLNSVWWNCCFCVWSLTDLVRGFSPLIKWSVSFSGHNIIWHLNTFSGCSLTVAASWGDRLGSFQNFLYLLIIYKPKIKCSFNKRIIWVDCVNLCCFVFPPITVQTRWNWNRWILKPDWRRVWNYDFTGDINVLYRIKTLILMFISGSADEIAIKYFSNYFCNHIESFIMLPFTVYWVDLLKIIKSSEADSWMWFFWLPTSN